LPTTNKGWQTKLTPEQYRVLRQQGTEQPGSSSLVDEHGDGVFRCAGCGTMLCRSDATFDSGTGWPSFTAAAVGDKVRLVRDDSLGLKRTEVLCTHCGGHLGHLFDDGPANRGGKRFCINGCALNFDKQ
jgi:peptide-methionine (R)-S-oxide reductase